jgi:hypothetical protein
MFPLADLRGRVMGFGARALAEGDQPKYLNSSESELFHKGRFVYGGDIARPVAAKAGRVVLVEGYTDVLALHQAGMGEAVAVMGTSLTTSGSRHCRRVRIRQTRRSTSCGGRWSVPRPWPASGSSTLCRRPTSGPRPAATPLSPRSRRSSSGCRRARCATSSSSSRATG